MHAFKGLEYRCVAVVGVREEVLPYPRAATPAEADPAAERCLLSIA